MAITDNFGNPQGFLGRLMLVAMEREHLPMAKWAFSLFDVPQEGQIADIGCGGGYNIKRLLQKSAAAKVWGLDISEESVKKARKVNKAAPLSRCEILQGSADALPFSDGQLAFVTAFETVFFWKDIERGFKEVRRVLKDGAAFAVVNNYGDPKIDWEKKVPCMTRRDAYEIQALMEDAGFKDVNIDQKGTLFCVQGTK
jgi:ubiquinone/menaquinone biosynthesis C-methylase UbiE